MAAGKSTLDKAVIDLAISDMENGMTWIDQTTLTTFALLLLSGLAIWLADRCRRLTDRNRKLQERLDAAVACRAKLERGQEAMLREMQHRSGNGMQSVASILNLSRRQLSHGADPLEVLEDSIGRISAMTRLHRRAQDLTGFSGGVRAVLEDVLGEMFQAMSVTPRIDIVPVALTMEQMTAVVLLVADAARDSIRHVFQRQLGSVFEVHLRELPDGRLCLTIHDDGPSRPPGAAVRRGQGMRVMEGLAAGLHGQLAVDSSDGTTIRLDFRTAPSVGARAA